MIKNNKLKSVISSAVILLPILIGLLLWNKLPDKIATHWGANGQANGWSSKPFAVFALPLFVFAIHWLCLFFTSKDPKNKGQSKKVFGLIFWICPAVSLFAGVLTYTIALGKELNASSAALVLIGLMYIILGNYMPKCKQNYTIGIKIQWTLDNEENWNATHRMAGKLWMICGLLFAACLLLPEKILVWAFLSIVTVSVVVPMVYSYHHYKKHRKLSSDDDI